MAPFLMEIVIASGGLLGAGLVGIAWVRSGPKHWHQRAGQWLVLASVCVCGLLLGLAAHQPRCTFVPPGLALSAILIMLTYDQRENFRSS